jgi:hypothetical protein
MKITEKYESIPRIKEQTNEDLKFMATILPRGYLKVIGIKTDNKFSKGYVSQFFKGKWPINENNICILDSALEMLDEEKKKWDRINSNIKKVLK